MSAFEQLSAEAGDVATCEEKHIQAEKSALPYKTPDLRSPQVAGGAPYLGDKSAALTIQ